MKLIDSHSASFTFRPRVPALHFIPMDRLVYLLVSLFLCTALTVTPAQAFLGGLFKKGKEKKVLSAEELASQESRASAILQKAQNSEQSGRKRQARDLYRSIVKTYPRTDSAGEALFRSARIREAEGDGKRAFDDYQTLMTSYRNSEHFNEAVERQFAIAESFRNSNKKGFLGLGAPIQPSKLIEMFQQISKTAPQSNFAPKSLISVGHIYSKQGSAEEAIAAYQKVVDTYPNTSFATEAQYAIFKLRGVKAKKSNSPVEDRAQVEAGLDFVNQNPNDARTQEVKTGLDSIEERAAEKNYNTGLAYEKRGKFVSARVYYRDLVKNPNSKWAAKAQERLRIMDQAEARDSVDNQAKFFGVLPRKKDKIEMRTSSDDVVPIPADEGSGTSN